MSGEPLIGLSGVRVARDHGRIVLDGIDLALHPGERVGLVGPNGAGKSTLLHVIVGLLPVAAGQVAAFGRPCRTEREFAAVRRRVGLLFQDSDDQLFCPTVAEDIAFGPLNLGVGRAEAAAVVTRTLARVGLTGFEHRITYRLSGGEKRLVALATVLAMDPAVLLLDEPTTGLDQEAEERMLALLLSLDQAMVVVSHEPRVIDRLATRVVHLDRDGLKAA